MYNEPGIIINGEIVGPGCALTIRVALESFASYLSEEGTDDILGKELTKNYWNRIKDIRRAMGLYSRQADEKINSDK